MTLDELSQKIQSGAAVTPQGTIATGPAQDANFWNNLGTGGWAALNEAGMGLPRWLVDRGDQITSALGSKVKVGDVLDQAAKTHETANTIGTGTGLVGSMFIPGGAVTKGVGGLVKGAGALSKIGGLEKLGEGITKGGEFLAKTGAEGNAAQKIGQYALRGAGQAAEQAVPRVLTGNEDASSLPLSIGGGAILGPILGPLSKKLLAKGSSKVQKLAEESDINAGNVPEDVGQNQADFLAKQAANELNHQTLKDVGVDSRSLKQSLGKIGIKGAAAGRGAEEAIGQIAQGVRDFGIIGKKSLQDNIDLNNKLWENIGQGFEKNAPPTWRTDLDQSMVSNPLIQDAVSEASNLSKAQDTLSAIQKNISNPNYDVSKIRNYLGNLIKGNLHSANADDQVAAQVGLAVKNHFDDFVGNLSGQDVSKAKYLNKTLQPLEWALGKQELKLEHGFKEGSPTFEKAATFGLLGGGGEAGRENASGEDFDLGKTSLAAAGAALGGPLLSKAIVKAANKGTSLAGRAVSNLVSKNNPLIAEKLGNAIEAAPSKVSQGLGIGGGQAIGNSLGITTPKDMGAANQDNLEQPAAPENKTPQQFSPQFKSVIRDKLQKIYQSDYSDMNPNDFMKKVAEKTDNFTNIEKIAPIIYNDQKEREQFLTKYKAYNALKSVPIEKAVRGQSGLESLVGSNKDAGEARKTLKENILAMQPDLTKRAEIEKKFDKFVGEVNKNPALLPQFAQTFGLDFDELRQLGLAG